MAQDDRERSGIDAATVYDVAIVGGGVIGSAIAYFLSASSQFDGRVVVIEPDPTYARCATTRSWGGVRQQFSTPENVEMSLFGLEFFRKAPDLLAVDGDRPDLAFRPQGYLFLASPAGLATLERNCALQRAHGAATELLDVTELGRRFPWLSVQGIAAGGFAEGSEGWIDPASLLAGLRRKAISLGASYVTDRVTAVEPGDRGPHRLTLAGGDILTSHVMVNAAGPQAGAVAALCGLDLPVRPRKRMTFVFDCREQLPPTPLTIDPSGVAFRPEGEHYIAIVSPPADADPDSHDLDEDYALFEEVIWPALANRVPAFEAIKMVGAWAGHYDYNTFDQNALIGRHPDHPRLLFCNGFSGHGLQQAPAAGRAVAELICHGRFTSLDLSRFGLERLATGFPLREANVV